MPRPNESWRVTCERCRCWIIALVLAAIVLAGRSSAARGSADDDLLGQLAAEQGVRADGTLDLQQAANNLLASVGKCMGLSPRASVTVRERERSSLKRTLEELLAAQYPGHHLEDLAQALELIGLMERGRNLRREVVDLYQSQMAGFYDPRSKQMVLLQGASPSQQLQVLQHELAHALQDQYFPVQRLIEATGQDEDRALALQAVLEGQAVIAMFAPDGLVPGATSTDDVAALQGLIDQGLLEGFNGVNVSNILDRAAGEGPSLSSLIVPSPTPAFEAASPYLQAQLLFPYHHGTELMEALLRAERFDRVVRRTMQKPPTSTRQVLHPEVYLRGEEPERISVQLLRALPGWKRVYETTVGELNIRTLMGGTGVGDEIAEGWRGDHLVTLRNLESGQVTAGWLSAWENDGEALQFYQAYAASLAARPGSSLKESGADFTVWEAPPGWSVLKRVGRHVGLLAAVPSRAETLAVLFAALWDGVPGAIGASRSVNAEP